MTTITFQGMIVSCSSNADLELVVCCVSRIDAKGWRVISLEGKFTSNPQDLYIKKGMYVSGKAILLHIWDGSILVQFIRKAFQIWATDTMPDFEGKISKYVCNPRAERKIAIAAKEFYHFRLDETYYPQQIKWSQFKSSFGALPLALLTKAGDSMALLTGYAMLFAKRRIKYGKQTRKIGIFLLGSATAQTHNPVFMLAESDMGEPWQKGQVYYFMNLPILYNNDTFSSVPTEEAESTLFCGKGKFALAHNPDDHILSSFYDELGDVANMPEWLWRKYFERKTDRNVLLEWRTEIGMRLKIIGKLPGEKTHGWWHSWEHAATIKKSDGMDDAVAILLPDFADGGPHRIIALPETVYVVNRKKFPENSIAVSVSADPKIIEGIWQPDPQSWERIKNWIRKNEAALKREIIFLEDF